MVTLILLGEDATVVFEKSPVNAYLERKLKNMEKNCKPRSHGNYLPAFEKLALVTSRVRPAAAHKSKKRDKRARKDDHVPEPALCILFLSDGSPSDSVPSGPCSGPSRFGVTNEKLVKRVCDNFKKVTGDIFRARFRGCRGCTFHAIGFGKDEDFSVLRTMAKSLPEGVGTFSEISLDMKQVSESLSSFATSVMETKLFCDGAALPRPLRPVLDEPWRKTVFEAELLKVAVTLISTHAQTHVHAHAHAHAHAQAHAHTHANTLSPKNLRSTKKKNLPCFAV